MTLVSGKRHNYLILVYIVKWSPDNFLIELSMSLLVVFHSLKPISFKFEFIGNTGFLKVCAFESETLSIEK